ncbi:fungal-specific transcription factor domain-containing protein [Dichotomocladium elegans]|nr:fungal-specific transcription factor domain-containing protein [Dichotomocladium elegans]
MVASAMSSLNMSPGSIEEKKEIPQQTLKVPRQKRLKVNRACYTCRVKKIKCDGLQPCMQCRARQRPCSFSKDGPSEFGDDDSIGSAPLSDNACAQATLETTVAEEQEKYRKTCETLDNLCSSWPGEGREGRWGINEHLLYTGQSWLQRRDSIQSTRFCGSDDMVIQQHLITLFFRHRYPILPLVPRRLFYEHLEQRGSLYTPILIYSMYAHAAHYSDEFAPQASTYYNRAVSLLDEYLDQPRVSTIAALCLLSIYEPSRDPSNANANFSRCRSQIYSNMAFRMCYDLGINKRHLINERGSRCESELYKRVFWTCYCLDKMQNICIGKPWAMLTKDTDLDMPLLQPGDDTEEQEVIESFVALIKLFQTIEPAIHGEGCNSERSMVRSYEQEQIAYNFDNNLLLWLRSLPSHLQWTPFPQMNTVPTQPPSNAMIAHLHLFYNLVELTIFWPHSATNEKLFHQRCSTIATNITQLGCALAEQTNFILSYSFASEAIMAATRVHLLNCSNENVVYARQSRYLFQRSLRSLRKLNQTRVIPTIEGFVYSVKLALASADEVKHSINRAASDSTIIEEHHGNEENTHISNGLLTPPATSSGSQSIPKGFSQDRGLRMVPSRSQQLFNPTYLHSGLLHSSPAISWRPHMVEQYHHLHHHSPQPHSPSEHQQQHHHQHQQAQQQMQEHSHHEPEQHNQQQQQHRQHQHHQQQQQIQQQHHQHQQQRTNYALELLGVDENWSKSAEDNIDQFLYKGRSVYEELDSTFLGDQQQKNNQGETKMNAGSSSDIEALVAQIEKHESDSSNRNSKSTTAWDSQAEANNIIYSMWSHDQQDTGATNSEQPQPQQHHTPASAPPPQSQSMPLHTSYMNIGLGVYASAHQHHNDVIRQHYPGIESRSNPSVRPVILTHQGHVIVTGIDQEHMDGHPPSQ